MTNELQRESEGRSPSADSLQLLDTMARRISPDDPALLDWFERYRRRHRARLAADVDLLRAHVAAGGRILDCGAVPPLLTAAAAALDYRVSAVDRAPQRFAGANEELDLDVHTCDIETEALPFAAGSFDAVLLNEVFEHLRIDPIFTVSELRRVLKSDGKLLLSTPNLRSFRGLRNLVVRNQGHAASAGIFEQYEKLRTLGHMGHVREYTTREVVEFLQRCGFRPRRIVYRGGHGVGLVGFAERCAPSLRPFFTVIATPTEGTSP